MNSPPPDAITPATWLDCVLRDRNLGVGAKVVAAALSRFAADACRCSASIPAIATAIGASDRTAMRGVRDLLTSEWLRRIRDGGGRTSAEYGLTIPARGGMTDSAPLPNLTSLPEMTSARSAASPDVPTAAKRLTPAELELVLRRAGGREGDKAPGLTITGPIDALIDEGYDLERQILPVIRAAAAKGRTWTTWRYFVAAIREQNDVGEPALPRSAEAPTTMSAADKESGERAILRRWKESPHTWPASMGPRPGENGCRISPKILAEFDVQPPPPKPSRSGELTVDFGGGYVWPVSTVKAAIERWRKDPSAWPDVIGPPPGEPGCRVPLDIYDPVKVRAGQVYIARAYFEGKWEDGWERPKPGERGFPDDVAAEVAREFDLDWPPPPGWRPGQR